MSADAVNHMRGDADWRVRHAVASATRSRIVLRELAQRTDPIVRETATGRLDRGDAVQPEMAS